MNIIVEGSKDKDGTPYAVGTPNATEDVYNHVKPGRKRANFFRYFRFNLPRLTKVILVLVVAAIGGCALGVAVSGHPPFPHGEIALWIVALLAAVYVVLAVFTRIAIWDYGSMIAAGACIVYLGGILGNAPFVWNGASLYLAATWNLMLFTSLAYFVLNWAVNFGILVVWPDTQGFTD
ncbi:MAG: hypothetical protein CSB13_10110 [Chloroflexi bacterium]|nr:MAG: hypothetical protein CSB13_10110 [Chloroflexota bacterium]